MLMLKCGKVVFRYKLQIEVGIQDTCSYSVCPIKYFHSKKSAKINAKSFRNEMCFITMSELLMSVGETAESGE